MDFILFCELSGSFLGIFVGITMFVFLCIILWGEHKENGFSVAFIGVGFVGLLTVCLVLTISFESINGSIVDANKRKFQLKYANVEDAKNISTEDVIKLGIIYGTYDGNAAADKSSKSDN